MKNLTLFFSLFFILIFTSFKQHNCRRLQSQLPKLDTGLVNGQYYYYKKLVFSLKSNSNSFNKFKPVFQKTADSALIIAAAVLNSQEFRDSLSKYKFICQNYSDSCSLKCEDCDHGIISTKVILDSLYRLKRGPIQLILRNDGTCNKGGSFGFSEKDKFVITSHYITIKCDDTLSFAYKYAYHICHEYMHISGFYHFLPPSSRIRNQDVAEQTGWTAYYIITGWKKSGKKIF